MLSHFCIALRTASKECDGACRGSDRLVGSLARLDDRSRSVPRLPHPYCTDGAEPSLDSLCYIIYFMTANKRPALLTLTDKRNSRARIGSQISAARSDSQSHALSPPLSRSIPSSNHKQHQCDEVREHGTCATRRLCCVYLLLFTMFEKDGLSASPSLLVSACLASFVIHRLLRLSPFAALESGRRMEDLCIATCSVVMFT